MSDKLVTALAKEFCKLNAQQQAKFFSEVALTFHEWGDEREEFQINCIATSSSLKYGKIFISDLNSKIPNE